jgi:hypothetical protein
MIKNIKLAIFALLTVAVSSCELDLLDNPNQVTAQSTDINFLTNRIQADYRFCFNELSDPGMRLTRMLNQGAAIYDNAVTPASNDFVWNTSYAGLLTDIKTLIPIAENAKLFTHAGVGRTIRAAVLLNLVDAFGDVPFSTALDPNNFNPTVDGGAAVYTAAIKDLNDAIANFEAKSNASLANDLYYGGTADNWIRVANTLKLKALMNRRLVDPSGSKAGIDALIADGKLITTNAQNFTFKFGTTQVNPDNRHPRYASQYSPIGSGDYQSNQYMGAMYDRKDPRIRMYFYRQTIVNSTSVNEIRCITNQRPPHYSATDYFCYPTLVGYWGRDHLSNEGIPPDGLRRTAWGLYPAGGLYDNDAGKTVSLVAGAQGAGIHPIMMRSFVDFMLAESALTMATAGNAKTLLESGIRKSMEDVRSYALATPEGGKVAAFETANGIDWTTQVEAYVEASLTAYDNAATNADKLNVIANEYWFAAHGNGIEAYNLYRRTGMPRNLQPALEANPGPFVQSYYYPLAVTTRNNAIKQKTNATVPVFWDNKSAGTLR